VVQAKYPEILNDLRRRIASGELPADSRMPTWDVLARDYEVGRPTLMRAMAALKEEGFVITDSTRGSFVAAEAPCRQRFGLVFGSSPQGENGGWNRFWQVLQDEAPQLLAEQGLELAIYHGVDLVHGSRDTDRLRADLDGHRLAGLLVPCHGLLATLPELVAGRVPLVQLGGRWSGCDAPSCELDWPQLRRRAGALLHAAGARRVMVLGTESADFERWGQALAAAGLQHEPWWSYAAGIGRSRLIANLVRLMMIGPMRPAGLLVTDDNLVPGVVLGLAESGVRVGAQLHVVTHCNWPFPTDLPLPLTPLGFDLRVLLRRALAQLHGDGDGDHGLLPAVTAEELAPAPALLAS